MEAFVIRITDRAGSQQLPYEQALLNYPAEGLVERRCARAGSLGLAATWWSWSRCDKRVSSQRDERHLGRRAALIAAAPPVILESRSRLEGFSYVPDRENRPGLLYVTAWIKAAESF